MDTTDALSSLSRRFRRTPRATRLHRWGVATAVTVDGATAELAVEYVVVLESSMSRSPAEDLETPVSDAVEDEIRRLITTSRLLELPGAGDTADWVERVVVPGARLEHAVVVRADVQLTPELRRLVAGELAEPSRWT